jgi:hypothetical protein
MARSGRARNLDQPASGAILKFKLIHFQTRPSEPRSVGQLAYAASSARKTFQFQVNSSSSREAG